MKIVKLTMLAATAVIAAMAFIDATAASATPPWIAVCLKTELLNCANANLAKHPLLGRVIVLKKGDVFKAGFVTIECTSGESHSEDTEAQQQNVFKFTNTLLLFNECKGCTGVTGSTPQAMTIGMETETGGWRLKANNVKVKFTGCPFGTSCTYEGNLNLEIQMNEKEMFVEPNGAALKRVEPSGGLCAETGKWEKGKELFDWELDNAPLPNGTRHTDASLSLIGANLIQKL